MLVEIADVRLAAEEPQQLVDDRLEVQLLGRHQRKAVGQVEPHLVAEDAPRAGAGAVALGDAFVENPLHQIEVLSHDDELYRGSSVGGRSSRPKRVTHRLSSRWSLVPLAHFCFAINSSTSLASSAGLSCFRRCSIRVGRQAEFFQCADDVLPLPLAALALGQVQLGHQLAEPLQRDRLAVLVVVLDDLLLVFRVFLVHAVLP